MTIPKLRRSIFQRILGISATAKPLHEDCWRYDGKAIIIDLSKIAELQSAGGAVRLEGRNLPVRVLVIKDNEGTFHSFHNKCLHAGRRLDHVPEGNCVQCCSVNTSTFSYQGEVMKGPAKNAVRVFPVMENEGFLTISIQ